ncbi:hypothetical protein CEXT_737771 [Caerostris extrusa]|uniref:Uncharacterized protein n=1 Tax=Caerostris extrusa TaxID=172846 RepID=A0AAV4Y0Y6_CAEEX|nr:hypothetical protein CEXT_737771 [Caerostris extrusa]
MDNGLLPRFSSESSKSHRTYFDRSRLNSSFSEYEYDSPSHVSTTAVQRFSLQSCITSSSYFFSFLLAQCSFYFIFKSVSSHEVSVCRLHFEFLYLYIIHSRSHLVGPGLNNPPPPQRQPSISGKNIFVSAGKYFTRCVTH